MSHLSACIVIVVDRNAAEVLAPVLIFQVEVLQDGVFKKVVAFEAFTDLADFLWLCSWDIKCVEVKLLLPCLAWTWFAGLILRLHIMLH